MELMQEKRDQVVSLDSVLSQVEARSPFRAATRF